MGTLKTRIDKAEAQARIPLLEAGIEAALVEVKTNPDPVLSAKFAAMSDGELLAEWERLSANNTPEEREAWRRVMRASGGKHDAQNTH